MNWISSLWSQIAGLTERIEEKETSQLVNALAIVGGLLLLFGLLAEPIVNAVGSNTIWANAAWIVVAVAGLVVMVGLIYQLLKRGYSNLRG